MEGFMSTISRFFCGFLLWLIFTSNAFSQSFNTGSYTQLSALTFSSANVGGASTKYVILCDILSGRAKTGEVIYYIARSNEYGNAALGFDMNESQLAQLAQMKGNKDYQLVFLHEQEQTMTIITLSLTE
jgi:hypothetical protein